MTEAKKYTFTASDAVREGVLLRVGLCGPSGSGKTKTGLILATRMQEQLGTGPIYVIDSENRSALRYAYSPRSRDGFRFKHVPMPEDDYSPQAYTAALDYCERQGAGIVLIDSLSHVWNGINGVLEMADSITEKSRTKNTFSEGWRVMSPVYTRLVQRLISAGTHMIFTARAKTEYDMQKNDRGKVEPIKVGLAPILREGFEYEVDLWGDLSLPHNDMTVSKTRIDRVALGEVIRRPGNDFADTIVEWMKDADPQTGPRTLGEAILVAAAKGIDAAERKSPDEYVAATRELVAWCRSHGVAQARCDTAIAEVKARVASVTGGKRQAPADAVPPSDPGSAAPPPETDEECARRIDAGQA